MASKIKQPVYCVFVGKDIKDKCSNLISYGVDEVFVYDEDEFKDFRIEPYSKAIENFIDKIKPTIVLVGGTTLGRSLAPRLAARFRTGLTADCTILDIQSNTDLDQIRPAFGGNIMAHMITILWKFGLFDGFNQWRIHLFSLTASSDMLNCALKNHNQKSTALFSKLCIHLWG